MDAAWIQLIGTLGGVGIGSLVTWLSQRSQYRLKELELKEQAKLRGKELLFQAYQTKVERVSQEIHDLGSGVGGILGLYAASDEEERQQLNQTFFRVAKESAPAIRERFEELEEARRKVGLAEDGPAQMDAVRGFLEHDMTGEKTADEIQRIVVDFAKATIAIPSLWEDVLEAHSETIFGEYADEPKLLRD